MTEPVSYYDWKRNLTCREKDKNSEKNTSIGVSSSTFRAHMREWRNNNL